MPSSIADFRGILLIASEDNDGLEIAMTTETMNTESKKRGTYLVASYDGKIRKVYTNYKCADKYANKLARNAIWCSLYELTADGFVELGAC